jgi:hypothetical protein
MVHAETRASRVTHCDTPCIQRARKRAASLADFGLLLPPPQVELVHVGVHGVAGEVCAAPAFRLRYASSYTGVSLAVAADVAYEYAFEIACKYVFAINSCHL